MTTKFTEEEYQKIVDAWDGECRYVTAMKSVSDFLVSNDIKFMGDKALAIANPLTREWAHDKFVEKEKKYYWKLKNNWEFALVSTRALVNLSLHNKSALTESEIREWGFNPDMFDREEVQ